MHKIQITNNISSKLKNGYPWVFRSDLNHSYGNGEMITLVDNNNRIVAFGLCDSGDISVRVLGKNPTQIQHLLQERITQAHHFRTRFLPDQTNCYRLINGEGDGLSGIIVDVYDDTAILRIYSKAWLPHLDAIVDTLRTLDPLQRIFQKFGVRNVDGQKGGITLWGSELPKTLIVKEHGIKFIVRPKKGQKTGLFLDQRTHRKMIGELSKDKVVSNLFSYNGGFSIYAAMNGAKRVYSVDIAPKAIEDAKDIFLLNGINPDHHVFEATDAFQWQAPESIEVFVCDPPSLSKGKRSDSNAQQAYQNLAQSCAKQIQKGNVLATASCTARLSSKAWEQSIIRGIERHGEWSWAWRSYEPIDHPILLHHTEARYLKFALLYRRK